MRNRGAMLATALFATPLAAVLLATPQAAVAQPVQGLYLGAGAGLLLPQDPRITPLGPGFGTGKTKIEENEGYDVVGAVGYGIGNGFRFEIEGDFNRAGMRHLGNTPFPTATDGTVRTYGVMANALYDMDIGVPYFYPYVGLGAGYQWTNLTHDQREPGGPFAFSTDDPVRRLCLAGHRRRVLADPRACQACRCTADYRFMDILGGEKFDGGEVDGGPAFASDLKLHDQFDHSIMFGVRYAFNTPAPTPVAAPAAPAPVAAPAPAPARSYLVFFDWDKADLTDGRASIIKEAADNSTHVQVTRIEVNGYTDTSGTPQYNQGLSVRRAQAVAGELVRDGVPQNAIDSPGLRRHASAGCHGSRRAGAAEPARRDHHSLSQPARSSTDRACPSARTDEGAATTTLVSASTKSWVPNEVFFQPMTRGGITINSCPRVQGSDAWHSATLQPPPIAEGAVLSDKPAQASDGAASVGSPHWRHERRTHHRPPAG